MWRCSKCCTEYRLNTSEITNLIEMKWPEWRTHTTTDKKVVKIHLHSWKWYSEILQVPKFILLLLQLKLSFRHQDRNCSHTVMHQKEMLNPFTYRRPYKIHHNGMLITVTYHYERILFLGMLYNLSSIQNWS